MVLLGSIFKRKKFLNENLTGMNEFNIIATEIIDCQCFISHEQFFKSLSTFPTQIIEFQFSSYNSKHFHHVEPFYSISVYKGKNSL